jgi:NADP-dependent 3-hydroxy acid dehydrogenase YdfG
VSCHSINFNGAITDRTITNRIGDFAISPDAIAQAIAFAIEQPAEVDVGDIVIRPTAQD